MTVLRLLADDLTGALDSAAGFASPEAPVPVRWKEPWPAAGSLALDSGTREAGPAEAGSAVRRLAPMLAGGEDAIAYKKIDSLLRGNEAEEIAAAIDALRPDLCILAPAFPAQGRVTRAGRQFAGAAGGRQELPLDLAARLTALGHRVHHARSGDEPRPGLTLFDAESDGDLDRIAASGLRQGIGSVLWVGSGGLAAALARAARPAADVSPTLHLTRPVLGLFGTDHPAMRAQIADVAQWHEAVRSADEADRLRGLLETRDALLVGVALPHATPRGEAARRIADLFGALVRRLDAPGTLVAAGGETLRGLCAALEAEGLDVTGEVMPGIPRSTLVGGRWAGTPVVSKSGAFGAPDLLRHLIAAEAAPLQGAEA